MDVDPIVDTTADDPGPPAQQRDQARSRFLIRFSVILSVVLLISTLSFVLVMAALEDDPAVKATNGTADTPLRLESMPADLAQAYRFAEEHEDLMVMLPCFCGCEKSLGHRHLYDCFVQPDGAGYETHAMGCGICRSEAALAETLFQQGEDPAAVRAAIIERFGSGDTSMFPPPA